MTNEPIDPNERIRLALAACYEVGAELSALWTIIPNETDGPTERVYLRALQFTHQRRVKANDALAEAVRDAADLRRYEGPHRWRHDDRACDEWFTK